MVKPVIVFVVSCFPFQRFSVVHIMTPNEFSELARQGYNRIPLVREVLADLDTPLSTYLKLASGRYSYLLESVQGERNGDATQSLACPVRLWCEFRDTP